MLIELKDLVRKYNINIDGVIHVGGHYGTEVEVYDAIGVKKVHLFEPIKHNFDTLCEFVNKFEIEKNVYNLALGDFEGEVDMFVSDNQAQSSSILKPKVHLEIHSHVQFPRIETVRISTLDKFEIADCNFLNMDVQGYELNVLKGATKTLERIDYVYCEVNKKEVYEKNGLVNEIDDFLSTYGFVRVETGEWVFDAWTDALYIKK